MKNYKAQVALITVMLIATVLTVVLSISFQTTSDTQATKLEEESQKALAAAEAAVEASIKSGANTTLGSGNLTGINGYSGGATVSTVTANSYTTGRIEKNNSYTFYLAKYHPELSPKQLGTESSLSQAVTVCFQSNSPNPALEITLLKNTLIRKYAVEPSTNTRIASHIAASGIDDSPNSCPSGFQYFYQIPAVDIGTGTRLIVVKVLFNGTKLYFYRTNPFYSQGTTASANATSSQTGVSKKIILFQTNPQIPADFFDTSF